MKIKTAYNPGLKNGHLGRYCMAASLILVFFIAAAIADEYSTISPQQANILIHKLDGNPDFVILDLRTPGEFESGHIEGALLIDYYSQDFSDNLWALDKSKTYLIYCETAQRSTEAYGLLKDMDFTTVYLMDQGIVGWENNGFAVVK